MARQGRGGLDTRGDVIIWCLLEIHTYAIVDFRFGDADVDTYKYEAMDNILAC